MPVGNGDTTSLGNPDGGGRSFNYSIQVGSQRIKASTKKSVAIDGVALRIRYLVKIYRDGKQVSSFRFSFEKEGRERLCMWYKSLYETWSISPLNESKDKCGCK